VENGALQVQRREATGKQVRSLRRQGFVPANLYGKGEPSVALQMPQRELETFLARHEGAALVRLALGGKEPVTALLKDVQRHPVNDHVLHVDFQRVSLREKVRVEIPLHFTGEAPAAKSLDGTLLHNLTAVEIEAAAADLPAHLEVDVSPLIDFNAAIHVSDIQAPRGVQVLTPPEELVAKVVPPAVVVEEAAEEAAAEEAGAAPAEGTAEQAAEGEQP
jgi:large subunit ribosomal protein L25